jgi:methionyl-tRNA formyltransferase
MAKLRAAFFGTPDIAARHLPAVLDSEFQPVVVVTQPDRPRGRGLELSPPPAKVAALQHGLPVWQPEKLTPEFSQSLAELRPDLIVVVACGHYLPKAVLDIPSLGCVNVHFSLLPELRGAAPVFWAVRRGLEVTGVTTSYMVQEIDAGDIILQREERIRPDDTTGSLQERLTDVGRDLLRETLGLLAEGRAPRRPQDPSRATRAPIVKKEDGEIDWNVPAWDIERQVRACDPWPGAYARWQGKLLKVTRAAEATDFAGAEGKPGTIVELGSQTGISVLAEGGAVRLLEVVPAGRRRMSAYGFACGAHLQVGLVFG